MSELNYLPTTGDDLNLVEFTPTRQPSHTYKLDIEQSRIKGTTDKADAMKQAVYLILGTERYEYPIYSQNYGVELASLIGCSRDFAQSEAKRRITEALTQDDRIESVDGWEFTSGKNSLHAEFTVHTIYGTINAETEVSI